MYLGEKPAGGGKIMSCLQCSEKEGKSLQRINLRRTDNKIRPSKGETESLKLLWTKRITPEAVTGPAGLKSLRKLRQRTLAPKRLWCLVADNHLNRR